jgi:two-component system phosphate regulon sensor histidine kinase PhoR
MTSSVATPLHFAAHLLALMIALGAAVALGRDDAPLIRRIAGALGFLALAAGEALHGGGFSGEFDSATVALRTVGYVLLFGAMVVVHKRAALPAAVGFSGQPFAAAVPALLAGLATLWHRREKGRLVMGAGLLLLAAAEALLRWSSIAWSSEASHVLRVAGYLNIAWFVQSATGRSLRFRFMAGFVSVLLVVVLAVSVAVTQVIDRNVRQGALQRVREQALEATQDFVPLVQLQARGLVLLVEARLQQEGGGQAPDVQQYQELFFDVDFFLFLDAKGVVIGKPRGIDFDEGIDVAGTEVVQVCRANAADAASLDAVGARDLALIGCSPVRRGENVVALAVAGHFVDEELLDRIIAPGSQAAAFRGTDAVAVAATGPLTDLGPNEEMLPPALLGRSLEAFAGDQETVQEEVQIAGSGYFAAFSPLKRADRETIGILMVSEPATVVARAQREVIRLILLVTLGVVGLAFLLALVAARRITRPVLALTQVARQVQAGDLTAKAKVTASDEVGDLISAFNQMTDSVMEKTDRLREAARAEADLRGRLETVLNSMGDGLIAVDEEGRVVTYNPAAAAIFDVPQSEVLGQPIEDVLRGRDAEGRPLTTGEEMPAGLAFIRRPDRGEVPVAMSSAPLRDGSDLLLGRVYVLRDMTHEYEIERMKTEFLANVSHELRTPLTPIIGYSELMSRRMMPSERAQEFAGGILDSARRLERIVAMLVDFSAMEGGRMTIEAEPTTLRRTVLGAVEDWRKKSAKHHFVTRLAPHLPTAMVDPSLIRRVIDELLDNAVKYSPKGGKITVGVISENSRPNPMLRIDVADEGIGIEEKDLPTIFEDFRQVDASDTRPFGGLGLGLAFVRRIVEAHRGTITVNSAPGAGSTFSFTVPAAGDGRES